ncbi:MAG: hypothetical protein MGG11_10235 [Trichodesmium sp. MAG_R03]|nr:hypothetical protein [Trichodesmium sp. MAG_R03]
MKDETKSWDKKLDIEKYLISHKNKLEEILLIINELHEKTCLIISSLEKTQGDSFDKEENFDCGIQYYQNPRQNKPINQSICSALCYVQLERNNFKEASAYFHQASLFKSSCKQPEESKHITLEECQNKVYDLLWKNLNCVNNNDNLERIKNNLDFGNFLENNNVKTYFAALNSCKVIELHKLTQEEAELLRRSQVSIEYLESIKNDHLENSSKSTNNPRTSSYENDYLTVSYPTEIKDEVVFQDIIAETGYMHATCPFTGKIVQSNQSFFSRYWTSWYRFVSRDVFYVLVCQGWSGKRCVYFPNLEIIILIHNKPPISLNLTEEVNRLKSFLVNNWRQAIDYITCKENKQTVALTAFNPQMGHYLWNELTGIKRLCDSGRIKNIDKFIIGHLQYFGSIQETFSEIDPSKIAKYGKKELTNLGKFILENNYFAFKPGDRFIPEKLVERIRQISVQKCSESFLQEVEESKQYFPLIWINIRAGHSGHREWVGEVDGIANIIRQLTLDYPNAAVVFDGASRIETTSFERDEKMIQVARDKAKQILDLLPENHIKIYNTIGSIMYESIVWASTVNFYAITAGSGACKASWVTGKPCITYGPHHMMELVKTTSLTVESKPLIRKVPNEFITEAPTNHKGPYGYDWFYCDWKGIYQEMVQLIEEIKHKKAVV